MNPSDAPTRPDPRNGGPSSERVNKPYPPRLGPSPHGLAWDRETGKCIGREVMVTQFLAVDQHGLPVFDYHKGICVALQSTHLSVILMTETEKILIKNVATIRRVRSRNDPQQKARATREALGEVLAEALAKAPDA